MKHFYTILILSFLTFSCSTEIQISDVYTTEAECKTETLFLPIIDENISPNSEQLAQCAHYVVWKYDQKTETIYIHEKNQTRGCDEKFEISVFYKNNSYIINEMAIPKTAGQEATCVCKVDLTIQFSTAKHPFTTIKGYKEQAVSNDGENLEYEIILGENDEQIIISSSACYESK